MAAESVWHDLSHPAAPPDRPWVLLNMVTTIDGKILSGGRDEPVGDLGSDVDHATMKAIERSADAILLGAATLRAIPRMNFPPLARRYCLTREGGVDPGHDFFAKAQRGAWLVMPESSEDHPVLPSVKAGRSALDPAEALRIIRQDHGVESLLCEGGSEANALLLGRDLVDEIFWTIAPKIRLGRDVPTMADGEPFLRAEITQWQLAGQALAGSEIFLRYRRHR